MRPQLLDRLILPIAIPVAVLVAIAFILISLSRILLAVPKEVAPPVALAVALLILLGAAYVATHPMSTRTLVRSLLVLEAALVVGGVVGQIKYSEQTGEATGEGAAVVNVSAKSLAFSVKEIVLASGEVTIRFDNQDSVPHNIAIYKASDAQEPLFVGEIIPAGASIEYKFTAPPPGQYYFQCDVHPAMNGTVAVEAAPAGATSVSSKNTAFSTKEIKLPAGKEATIRFDNQEGVPHNIAIYKASDAKEPLFEGRIITGPTTIDYKVPALPPGQYYFQCDVHPKEMTGAVKVE